MYSRVAHNHRAAERRLCRIRGVVADRELTYRRGACAVTVTTLTPITNPSKPQPFDSSQTPFRYRADVASINPR